MSSDSATTDNLALRVRDLSKAYRVYARPIDRLRELLFPRAKGHEVVHALHPLSFDVVRGQSMGVIGANGAGKTTLLSLLTGTLAPTTGTIEVFGTVSAILGLGLGMLPTYTGRENIRHGLIARGVPFDLHDEKTREIIEFSELEDAIDKPVRTYSSGMGMRLSFAIAHAVEPDILIVDEALSVGDARFVFKCQKKIREFLDKGRTLFFVSHNVPQVKLLCASALLLEKGRLIAQGDVNSVLRQYQMQYFGEPKATEDKPAAQSPGTFGTGGLTLSQLVIHEPAQKENSIWRIEQGADLVVDVTIDSAEPIPSPAIGVVLRSGYGDRVTGFSTVHYQEPLDSLAAGRFNFRFRMPFFATAGTYKLEIVIADVSGSQPRLLRIWEEAALIHLTWANYGIGWPIDCGAEIDFRGQTYSLRAERDRREAFSNRNSGTNAQTTP